MPAPEGRPPFVCRFSIGVNMDANHDEGRSYGSMNLYHNEEVRCSTFREVADITESFRRWAQSMADQHEPPDGAGG